MKNLIIPVFLLFFISCSDSRSGGCIDVAAVNYEIVTLDQSFKRLFS